LRRQGYQLAAVFPFELPDGAKLYEERRYELHAGITPTEQRPRKTCRFCHGVGGVTLFDTGSRRIIYNWPAIMRAGPGATVHVAEGANKSAALNAAGLLATAVAYHKWEPECVSALAGHHLIYHEDCDANGRKFSADARKHLAPIAASFRIVPVAHLFKQLGREPWPTADVKDWLEAGGDSAQLQRICDEIPAGKLPFPFVDTSRWRTEQPPDREWAVPDRIPRRQVALFSGEGAAGKSTILLHECAAHVLARDWLGVMPTPGAAFFIDAEDDQDEVWRRLTYVARHYDATVAAILDHGFRISSLFGDDALLATVSKGGTIEPTPRYHALLEAAGDLKPIMIGIASSACVFAGEENNRSQVQQFVGLLTKIAIAANGSIQLVSHPSLTGINTDTGLSGTTQWHNAVRARSYLKGVKAENGELADSDLREIVFKKNQYGRLSESIVLRYQGGLYLPVAGVSFDQAERAQTAQDVFLALLKRFTAENRAVFAATGKSFAPAVFAREDEAVKAQLTSKNLEAAMRELFRLGRIWNEEYGKPSRPSYRIALKAVN
jgi:RecA-family ATPase